MAMSLITRLQISVRSLFVIGLSVLIAAIASYSYRSYLPSTTTGNFVSRSGSQLQLNGQPFRFSGANMYWLGLDENVGGLDYPTHFRVDDAFAAAGAMGTTVVRAHTLGISVGCILCVEPSLGVFNTVALSHIDYAIKSARDHHIHLIIPLTDNYRYYHGGKHTFTDWRHLSNEDLFYSNPTIISDFEQYISTLLNHVNTYTGIAYKNDPTILAWETGNELLPPASWTQTIAHFLKQLDPHHLVIDGSSSLSSTALSLANVDIYDHHYYPMNSAQVQKDATMVNAAHKVFYVGEYAWNGPDLTSFLSIIQSSGTAGDTYWSFFPHNDNYGYVEHNDGYTLHYPGDTNAMRQAVQLLTTHAYQIQGLPTPKTVPTPGLPLITRVAARSIAWRGTALGASYSVERSTTGANGTWQLICYRCATDNDTPWTDTSKPSVTSWYRVRAYNLAGDAGNYSPIFFASS